MPTTMKQELLRMPGANLGGENPLPDIQAMPDIHSNVKFDPSIPPEECRYFNYGRVNGILPYRMQDQYDRDKQEREYPCVVLENDFLRAVFLPQFGGKLWSLRDKEHGRDLLHVNPVFQPANLALRNAWTSGGVEWNIGMTGHTPYTLSPLHTAFTALPDGTPVLRMYEWERIRQVSYQLDAYLPEGSRRLFIRVRLRNTRDEEVPIYWWSNMAVDEKPDVRVIAPAGQAFCFDYSRVITKMDLPLHEGRDCTYTTRIPRAMDLFFDIPEANRKWEAALDGDGFGLVHASTRLLQGRKLFMWGNGAGGRHWQEFLAAPGKAYLEIQAGLANTQMEHLPMSAGACWEWLESYGCLKADPVKVHGGWREACACVQEALDAVLPENVLEDELRRLASGLAAPAPVRLSGSGWAALELRRRGGGDRFPGEAALFPAESLGEEQAPWLSLLETGIFPAIAPEDTPAAYLTQREWLPLLQKAARTTSGHWHSWYQLGVMHCACGDFAAAREDFEASLRCTPNAWAKRCLAVLERMEGRLDSCANLMLDACRMLPILPLAIECGQALLLAGRHAAFVDFCDGLPLAMQQHGRLRALRIQAAIELEEFDLAQEMLAGDGPEICDMREGEILLSDLWIRLWMRRLAKQEGIPEDAALRARVLAEYPVPARLDFRMNAQ